MNDNLVQPICVLKDKGYHEEIVRAVAVVSVGAYLANPSDPLWNEWLKGRFTKTVRRGTRAQIDSLYDLSESSIESDYAVLGFKPLRYEDFPPDMKKMRVADYNRPRCGEWAASNNHALGPTIIINKDLNMSTGKTAAQVAHALFANILKNSDEMNKEWNDISFNCMTILEYNKEHFEAQVAKNPKVVITDAGFTELNGPTDTVIVL